MNCEQFNSISRLLPEPLLLVSSNGEIRSANRAAEKAIGRPLEQMRDTSLFALVEEPAEHIEQFLRACSRTRQMIPGRLTWVSSNGRAADHHQWEGTVMQPWSPESPALLLLRQKHDQSARGKSLLLTQKIDELSREVRSRKQVERRMAFLASAGKRLSETLDYEATLGEVADLIVPELADWFVTTLFFPNKPVPEAFDQVVITHKDPEMIQNARRLRRDYPPDPWASRGAPYVIRTGASEFYPQISDELLVEVAQDEEHLRLLRITGMKSAMVVPMKVSGRTIGALSLARDGSSKQYTRKDLQFVEELALSVGINVTNARLFKEAEEARHHAETMNRLKSAFLANMSHEIRTPLTAIIGLSSLLARKLPPEHQEYAKRIESGGHRLLETLNAVLSLAQLEAQAGRLELEQRKIADEVRDVLQLFEQQAEEKNLMLHLDIEPGAEEAYVRLDPGAFNSILHNLVGNALKYTEEGGVHIRVMADQTNVFLKVEDTGIGIDKKVLPYIFDAFRQESKGWGRTHEGVGIGLSISRRLVDQLNGDIEVKSTKGEGSTFTLRLPRALEDDSRIPAGEAKSSTKTDPSLNARSRILVVEDNEDTRFFFRTLLEDVGMVHTAADADAALQQVHGASDRNHDPQEVPRYDVMVIDINLGVGPDGLELLRDLRSDPVYQSTPMIAVTAYAMPGDRKRLLEAGFDAYLDKPFRANELLDVISEFLDRGRATN